MPANEQQASPKASLCVVATQASPASIDSHMVVAKSATALKGTMVLSNSDQSSVDQSKGALSDKLTEKVQAGTGNSNSIVSVSDVRQLDDGTLALDYECTGVSDTGSAKDSLNNAVKQDDVKETIRKTTKAAATTKVTAKPVTTQTSRTIFSPWS